MDGLAVGLGAIFVALVLVTLALMRPSGQGTGVARSLAVIEQMRVERVVALAELPLRERLIRPLQGRASALARRLSPAGISATLQRRLDLAGNPASQSPERILAYKGIGLVAGLALGLLFGARGGLIVMLLISAGLAAALFFLPDVLVYNVSLKRQEKLQLQLPDALDMLTVSVEAGQGFDAALVQVARNNEDPIAGEFFRALQEMQIGKSRAEAFQGLGDRTTVDELKIFVSALVQADRLGIPVANVLREQAREMRLKRRQRAEEKAAKVPVKILFPLIVCIFPVMFIIIIGPGAIQIAKSF